MELSCSLLYTPSNNNLGEDIPSYICSDNKIHIRFKDYNSTQRISGFEDKLTYLVSYLMNCCYLPKVIKEYDNKILINDFLKTSDLTAVLNSIRIFTNEDKLKAFKLSKNYNKKQCKYFGDIDLNCFPIDTSKNVITAGSLNSFLRNFKGIDLNDYLFNDAYEVIIHQKREIKPDKFDKKQLRKLAKSKEADLVNLWD